MKILAHLLISAVAVFAAAHILPGVTVDGFGTAVVVAIVLGLVNGLLRPLLLLLTLPLNILTLGLFTFVIIGGLVSATLLTLIVLPTLYVVFESRGSRIGVTEG